jgi:hypothetical protein
VQCSQQWVQEPCQYHTRLENREPTTKQSCPSYQKGVGSTVVPMCRNTVVNTLDLRWKHIYQPKFDHSLRSSKFWFIGALCDFLLISLSLQAPYLPQPSFLPQLKPQPLLTEHWSSWISCPTKTWIDDFFCRDYRRRRSSKETENVNDRSVYRLRSSFLFSAELDENKSGELEMGQPRWKWAIRTIDGFIIWPSSRNQTISSALAMHLCPEGAWLPTLFQWIMEIHIG